MAGKLADRLRRVISGSSGDRKRPPKETMLIIFLSGILIFVIMLPTEKSNSSYSKSKSSIARNSADTGYTGATEVVKGGEDGTPMNKYKEGLETELEDFLSHVAGVGEVDVLIYMKNSQEYIVEKDSPVSNSTNGDSSEMKKEESTVYTKNTDGYEVPFVSQTRSPEIDGVVVAATGASDERIRLQITRLVMALYGVDANKVEVLQMG